MSTFSDKRTEATLLRRQRRRAENRLCSTRNLAAAKSAELDAALRQGKASTELVKALKLQKKNLADQISSATKELKSIQVRLGLAVTGLLDLDNPDKLIEEWDDRKPILLLPVRVETRFMQKENRSELWVRIFPDDVAIHTHETDLTADEIADGRAYWTEMAAAAGSADNAERREKEKGAWRALSGTHGGSRASWVAAQTRGDLTPGEMDAGKAFWVALAAAGEEENETARETLKDNAWQQLAEAHGQLEHAGLLHRPDPIRLWRNRRQARTIGMPWEPLPRIPTPTPRRAKGRGCRRRRTPGENWKRITTA
jgi:hypothetical protein